ncbi:hypothetical protein PC41400_26350 [Paenibacillus chitinolyticus]|uniref:Uncharacterized protein n=1 Tax=Paenibacillus chitinolyticus TaxID=79263 RepID=A0A410X305_9BACL|nr:hypothetical protein PC41400_26350 [Paenibacillus chitinolyticus]
MRFGQNVFFFMNPFGNDQLKIICQLVSHSGNVTIIKVFDIRKCLRFVFNHFDSLLIDGSIK